MPRHSKTACALALLIVLSGCNSSLKQTLSTEVSTQFLYYKVSNQKKGKSQLKGGLGDLFVEVSPNSSGRAPVRYAETVSGGMGDTWRATIWMALMAASAALDIDPMSIRVTMEALGSVDGPSAGALMTAAIMAGVKQHPVESTAVVTGTINPDLTIGPVGGVPTKVSAALDAGKKRIGFPVGQLEDDVQGPINIKKLKESAKNAGAKLIEIRTVRDAYEVLTGKRIDFGKALPKEAMRLPQWASNVFADHAMRTVKQIQMSIKGTTALILATKFANFAPIFDDLKKDTEYVEKMVKDGSVVTAVYMASQLQASHFELTTVMLTELGAQMGRWDYVRKLLRGTRTAVANLLDISVPVWKTHRPRNALEFPYTVDTFEAIIHAIREFSEANDTLSDYPLLKRLLVDDKYVPQSSKEQTHIRKGLRRYTRLMVDAKTNLLLGRAYLAVGTALRENTADSVTTEISEKVVTKLSSQYKQVADANLQYVDSLLVQDVARRKGQLPKRVRQHLMAHDDNYRQAVMNRRLPSFLTKKVLNKTEKFYAELSGAVSSYFASATLISKRYSMGVIVDPKRHTLVGIKRHTALTSMLKNADREARQVAAQCQALLGGIPITSLIEYDLGTQMWKSTQQRKATKAKQKLQNINMRIEALGHLWRATTLGRLAIAAHRQIEVNRDTQD